ncbi:glycosyltransferase family 2 protein [Pseudonocardia humida]|uniref:Glycosyltransferase family 2 protein n=1 Tax=Pseudonocardia humida TaxID=2800819 RepID=A0ABT0ZVI3_9PSEU|nr:dTDP-Rha--alpha-D-GlcNAc-pyrophosphate polyprenol alpha-3-L-rhamnosyltransferase [Pseudonocardia humida]MCO1654741.1 glycosyltransferase family 2 protein [Pseudonocardia humida]
MRGDPITSYGDDLVVVTVLRPWPDPPALDRLIRSVPAATARPARVVVADSGTGATVTAPAVEVLRLGEDVGRAAAVNRAVAGLDPAVGWVALAAPEVEWAPGALDALLAAVVPRAGAVGPALVDPSGRPVGGGGDVPSAGRVLLGRESATPPTGGVVGWLPASCLLLRRTALDSVDGFDPRYVDAFDDVDLGARLARAGWLTLRVPAAVATVHPSEHGSPEHPVAARRRYVHDRSPAVARALLGLAGRGPRS